MAHAFCRSAAMSAATALSATFVAGLAYDRNAPGLGATTLFGINAGASDVLSEVGDHARQRGRSGRAPLRGRRHSIVVGAGPLRGRRDAGPRKKKPERSFLAPNDPAQPAAVLAAQPGAGGRFLCRERRTGGAAPCARWDLPRSNGQVGFAALEWYGARYG
jgi:hypothetical protein